jgi:hypothetical protein
VVVISIVALVLMITTFFLGRWIGIRREGKKTKGLMNLSTERRQDVQSPRRTLAMDFIPGPEYRTSLVRTNA